MSRKYLVCCLCLGLGGVALAAQPAIQFFPPPGSGCFGPPKIQPVTVSQFNNSKPVPAPLAPLPPAAPAVTKPAPSKPTVVEFHSSGPLPPLPVLPTPANEAEPEQPVPPAPDEIPEATEPTPQEPKKEVIPPEPQPQLAPQKLPVPQPKPFEFTPPPVGVDAAPWVIRVEVIESQTHLIATSKSAEFHILCQHLKVQSPTGDIQAEGEIKVNAVGLDMECERVIISWKNDWVLLEGKVHLQTQKDGQKVELTGDKLQLKLTTLTATSALKTAKPQLIKAAYAPSVTEIKTAGTLATPPAGTATPTLQPYYKRVTADE